MTSTEDDIRDFLVTALQAIAQDKLGFSDTSGNIKDYPLEYENDELTAAYLAANVGGKKKLRAWSVNVLGADTIYAQGGVTRRDYQIVFAGYYGEGKNGEGYKNLITHSRKIREKLKSYGVMLNNMVDSIVEVSPLAISLFGSDEDGERLLKGEFAYAAQKINPDF